MSTDDNERLGISDSRTYMERMQARCTENFRVGPEMTGHECECGGRLYHYLSCAKTVDGWRRRYECVECGAVWWMDVAYPSFERTWRPAEEGAAMGGETR